VSQRGVNVVSLLKHRLRCLVPAGHVLLREDLRQMAQNHTILETVLKTAELELTQTRSPALDQSAPAELGQICPVRRHGF